MSPDLAPNSSQNSAEKHAHGEHYQQREYATKRTCGQKTKRHCARFWWLHLIIFCIVFLVVALIVVYVGMPRIAQHQVDDATLEFREGIFADPQTEQVTVTQNGILHNPSVFTPTLDEFPADLYLVTDGQYGPEPMMTLPMPSIHAKKKTDSKIENAVVAIKSQDQLGLFAVALMTNENITTALVGKTKLHLGKLPTQKVTFNTTSTYKALNGLKGFNTTDLRINLTAAAGTPNLVGNAKVPNASLLTFVMGNVTLELSTSKGVVGNATIENFTLVPGANSFPMRAIVDQPLVISSLNAEGKVNMSITGQSAIYNGQHLPYYEKALSSNVLTLEMNVKQILADSTAANTAER